MRGGPDAISPRQGGPLLALAWIAAGPPLAAAADPCSDFTWDVSRERQPFARSPTPVIAGADSASAPLLAPERLYVLQLKPLSEVTFVGFPGRQPPALNAYGGLAALQISTPGLYRIALDVPYWIDVVADGGIVSAKVFQRAVGCSAPHKILDSEFPVARELMLQFSGSAPSSVRAGSARPVAHEAPRTDLALAVLCLLAAAMADAQAPTGASAPAAAPRTHFEADAATTAYMATLSPQARARSDAYFEGGYWLALWDCVIASLLAWLLLATGLSLRMRLIAQRCVRSRTLQSALYALAYIVVTALVMLPWAAYEGYFREHHYGLSNQSLAGWLSDQLKAMLILLLFGTAAIVAVYALMRRAPRRWWIWRRWRADSSWRCSGRPSARAISSRYSTTSMPCPTARSSSGCCRSRAPTPFPRPRCMSSTRPSKPPR